MAEKELTIFLILINVVLLIFIGGIIAFVGLYRQRKIQYKRETQLLQQLHEQQLMETQLEIQQQTMRDIGREIHDNVGQKLTLASIYSKSIVFTQDPSETALQVSEIAKLIDTSLQDLRQLSKSLVHPELAQRSLSELLQQEANQTNQIGHCAVHLTLPSEAIGVETALKNNVFRIVQEFIQNSLKHAHCQDIWVIWELLTDRLSFQLRDNGRGFKMGAQVTGIGIVNIQRRLAEIGAQDVVFRSEVGQGTTLHFSIQYSKPIHEIHRSNRG